MVGRADELAEFVDAWGQASGGDGARTVVITGAAGIGKSSARSTRPGYPADVELTAREIEVLGCLAAGMSNKQVARRLDISIRTVTVHVSNLLRKTRSASRTEAAPWAVRHRRLPGN